MESEYMPLVLKKGETRSGIGFEGLFFSLLKKPLKSPELR